MLAKIAYFIFHPDALRSLVTNKPFSLTAYRLVKSLSAHGCTPGAVIDVGANEGQFSSAILYANPELRVVAFEPLPEVARRFELNFLHNKKVSLVQRACGERTQKCSIHLNSYSQSSSILSLSNNHLRNFPTAREIGSVEIEVMRLDDAVLAKNLPTPILLKIDVQGYELHVLEGARMTLENVQHVLVETCFVPMYQGEPQFDKVFAFLAGMGFSFVAPLSILWEESTGKALQMDALFERRL